MNLFHLDPFDAPVVPLTSSRYPSTEPKKRFSFNSHATKTETKPQNVNILLDTNQTSQHASLPQSPSNTNSAAASVNAAASSTVQTPKASTASTLASPRSNFSTRPTTGAAGLIEAKTSDPSDSQPPVTDDERDISAVLAEIAATKSKRESRRTLAFTVDKFLTSNQHLSTDAERLHAAEILKKRFANSNFE